MVPRAYLYTSSAASTGRSQGDENGKSIKAREVPSRSEKKRSTASRANPAEMLIIPPATPSQPVVIPTRTRVGGPRRKRQKAPEGGLIPGLHGSRHNPQAIPPSVAALLAVTSIPGQRPTKRPQRGPRAVSPADAESPRDAKASRQASSDQSPRSWGILLSPPCEADPDDLGFMSDTTRGPLSSFGSLSSESMPALEADTDSLGSASSPSTPGITIVKRNSGERRPKASPSMSEDCILNHPLLPGTATPTSEAVLRLEDRLEDVGPLPVNTKLLKTSKSTFKSNLTASLRILKSAAVSFSNFTAPIVQRDDYLARAVLSISLPFTDERRPLSTSSLPDPALRRYLNPISISPAELHFHHDQPPGSICTASIQLRTVRKGDRKTPRVATAPPVFAAHPSSTSPAADPSPSAASTRQREPRENSDFLRVIVLEMNMRRAGKLAHTAPGRARLWLPARPGANPLLESGGDDGGIPRRWMQYSGSEET